MYYVLLLILARQGRSHSSTLGSDRNCLTVVSLQVYLYWWHLKKEDKILDNRFPTFHHHVEYVILPHNWRSTFWSPRNSRAFQDFQGATV